MFNHFITEELPIVFRMINTLRKVHAYTSVIYQPMVSMISEQ